MSIESPFFGISDQTTEAVKQSFPERDHLIVAHFLVKLQEMDQNHGKLHEYIVGKARDIPDHIAYSSGAALMYDAIMTQLRQEGQRVEITKKDIEAYEQRRPDEQEPRKGQFSTEDFREKFDETSKGFQVFIRQVIEGLEGSEESQISFLQGLSDVGMPLIMKIERDQGQKFWFA